MIDANALRKGVTFQIDNELYKVIEYSHHKPGRGLATIRVKAVNLRTGSNIEKTFSSSEKVDNVRLDYHNAQFLYTDGTDFHFMDIDTYEQPAISATIIDEAANFLKPEMQVKLTFYENEVLDLELPITVELEVVRAEPAVRGDTATGVNKKVELETGFEVGVPAFIEVGDVLKIDTRTGEYVTRV
ncbi:MAG TPA: elongation factor P [Anaerolineales bacterium]|nr:elongation factor P [Anaerolineales bacterium]